MKPVNQKKIATDHKRKEELILRDLIIFLQLRLRYFFNKFCNF